MKNKSGVRERISGKKSLFFLAGLLLLLCLLNACRVRGGGGKENEGESSVAETEESRESTESPTENPKQPGKGEKPGGTMKPSRKDGQGQADGALKLYHLRVKSEFLYDEELADGIYWQDSLYLDGQILEARETDTELVSQLLRSREKSRALQERIVRDYEKLAPGFDREAEETYYSYASMEYGLHRADSRILSFFCETSYDYPESRSHAIEEFRQLESSNYDFEKHRELSLSELVADTAHFAGLVRKAAVKKYRDYPEDVVKVNREVMDKDLEEALRENDGRAVWTMDYMGITVYFSELFIETGTSMYGIRPSVSITFSAIPGMDGYYTEAPESYILRLDESREYMLKLADGAERSLSVEIPTSWQRYGDDSYYYMPVSEQVGAVCWGEEEADWEEAHLECSLWLLKQKDRYFLYATNNSYEISFSSVFELTESGKIVSYPEEEGFSGFIEATANDPESFYASKVFWLLGTMGAEAEMQLDARGFPKAKNKYFYFAGKTGTYDIRLLTEEELLVLSSENSEKGVRKSFPAGTGFEYFRTEGEKFMDLKSEAGDIVRIPVEQDAAGERTFTVNGKPETEVFSGIIYAD